MKPIAPLWQAHLAVLLFGLSAPLSTYIGLPSVELTFARSFIAGVLLLSISAGRPHRLWPSLRSSWKEGLLLAFHWYTFFRVAIDGSVDWALISFATYPLWTMLLEVLVLNRRPSLVEWLKGASIMVGTVLLIHFNLGSLGLNIILLGLASALAFALLQLLNHASPQEKSSQQLAGEQMLWAAIFLVPFLSQNAFRSQDVNWILVLVHAVILTAIAYSLFIAALRRIGERKAAFISALEPIYGILFAVIFMNLNLHWIQILGGALVILPLFLRNGKEPL